MERGLLILLIGLALFGTVNAATYHVTESGSGSKSGADWNNAYGGLPAALQRGSTYYMADGSYGSYIFDDAASGTTLITVKKATTSDYGSSTGWSSSMGDGQAVFSSSIAFKSPYWVLDGNNEPDTYGFRLDFRSSRGVDLSGASHITLKNLHADGGSANANRAFFISGQSDIMIMECQVSNMGNDAFYISGATDIILDHVWVHSRNTVDDTHADFIENQGSNSQITIRYSRIDFDGQNIFFGGVGAHTYSDYFIHGNVFYSSGSVRSSPSAKAITDHSSATGGAIYFYNNVVHKLYSGHDIKSDFSGEARNNIYYDLYTDSSGSFWEAHSHNYFDTAIGNKDSIGGIVGGSPWVSTGASLVNYRLSNALASQSLSSTYNKDPAGVTRGSDGTWDMGTYEFGGSPSSCSNDCTSDATQCSGNGYQTCGNYDSDSCTEWSSVTLCATGQMCSAGECQDSAGLKVGDRIMVNANSSLRVRSTPGTSDALLVGNQAYGNQGSIIGGPLKQDGYTWWQIDFDSDPDGWVIEQSSNTVYLVPAGKCAHESDSDCDGCVNQDEMMQYITKWKSGQATLANLMEAIGKWKSGC